MRVDRRLLALIAVVAAIDPSGTLAERRFPTGGTLGHAALLLIGRLHDERTRSWHWDDIVSAIGELAEVHRRRWAGGGDHVSA